MLQTQGYENYYQMLAITYDSVEMKTDITKFSLFVDDDDFLGSRYNKEHEFKVIKWVLENHIDKNMGLTRQELNIGLPYKFYAEVVKPIIYDVGTPGDIDILAVDKLNPHKSIAFQVKRVKARINENGIAEIHDGFIKRGVEQAKDMFHKYRFHRNYLMLLIAADTMYRKNDSPIFRNLSYQEKLQIYRHPYLKELPEEIGVFMYEISQPSKNQINFTGTLAVKEHRMAKKMDQANKTTDSIIEYCKQTGA